MLAHVLQALRDLIVSRHVCLSVCVSLTETLMQNILAI